MNLLGPSDLALLSLVVRVFIMDSPSVLQVPGEEACDAAACVPGGGLVVAGPGDLRQEDQQRCRVRGGGVVDEPVARAGIHLDVMVDAERGERPLEPGVSGPCAQAPAMRGVVGGPARE